MTRGRHRRPRRGGEARRVAASLVALAAALLVFGLVAVLVPPVDVPASHRPAGATRPPARVAPLALRIPAISVHAGFERLSTGRQGHLRTPHHANRVGWYVDSPAPGKIGTAVVVGHVDTTKGPAVFWRLSELRPGDRVVVRRPGDTVRYVVRSVRVVSRRDFPTAAVYRPSPDRALRLITCGGAYDRGRGQYRNNVVVFAEAA